MSENQNRGGVTGMRLFLWAYIAKGLLAILAVAASIVLSEMDFSSFGTGEDSWTRMDWFRLVGAVRMGGSAVALAVCAVGLWLYVRLAARHRAGGLVWGAIAGTAVAALWRFLILSTYLLMDPETASSGSFLDVVGRWGWIAGLLGEYGCLVLVTLAVARVTRGTGGTASKGLTTAVFSLVGADLVMVGMSVLGLWGELGLSVPWLATTLDMGVNVGILTVLFLLVHAHLGHLATGPLPPASASTDGEADRFTEPPWPAVRRGLMTYRAGLIAKISVTVGGFAMILLAALARSQGFAQGVVVLMALAGMGTTIWMMAGMAGFTRVPDETGGRPGAVVALMVMGLGLLLDIYALVLVISLLTGSVSTVFSTMKQMPWIEGIAQVLGLVGMVAILTSFGRVGRFAGSTRVTSRVPVLMALLLGVALSAFAVRMLATERVIRGMGVIPLAVIVLGVAILAVVLYLRLLRDLHRAISGA